MFIMLTQLDSGNQLLVNADHVATVSPLDDGNGCLITLVSKDSFKVSESMEMIISMISDD